MIAETMAERRSAFFVEDNLKVMVA